MGNATELTWLPLFEGASKNFGSVGFKFDPLRSRYPPVQEARVFS